ncbi:hypothetical protein GCM10027047_16950 [Rhodococcus aerolatus]
MSTTPCPQRDLAVGWALHALEPEEEASVAAHLPLCAECRDQVAATEHTAALLGTGTPQLDPPARLRASILEAARAAGPARPAADAPTGRPVIHTVIAAPARTSRPRRVLVAAAAVLVLAVGAVGGWAGTQLGSGSSGQPTQVASGTADTVVRDLASPGVRQVVLSGAGDQAPVAVLLATDDHELLLPVDMPEVSAGEAIWMWGLDEKGVPVPLGDLAPAGSDALGARQVNPLPAAGTTYQTYAMSIEPSDGVPTVPTTVVASGQVRA